MKGLLYILAGASAFSAILAAPLSLDNFNALEVKHANLPRQKQFKALAAYTDEQEGADVMKVKRQDEPVLLAAYVDEVEGADAIKVKRQTVLLGAYVDEEEVADALKKA